MTTNCFAQTVNEVFAQRIKLPKNILLNIPQEALFIHGEYPGVYTLKNGSSEDTVGILFGKLFNSHVSTIDNNENEEMQFEANYLSVAYTNNFSLKFLLKDNIATDNQLKLKDSTIFLPFEWQHLLSNDSIKSIIFICYVRIDSKGNFLEKRNFIRPYLLVTNKKIYNIDIRLPSVIDYNLLKSYKTDVTLKSIYNGAFKKCKDPILNKKYIEMLKNKVIAKLQGSPFSATISNDFSIPNGEIWLKREYQKSNILGSPNFENSTYILKFTGSSNLENDDFINFYVVHALTVNIGLKGDYFEPDEKIISRYKIVVNEMVNNCIKEVCSQLNLKFYNNSCNCN